MFNHLLRALIFVQRKSFIYWKFVTGTLCLRPLFHLGRFWTPDKWFHGMTYFFHLLSIHLSGERKGKKKRVKKGRVCLNKIILPSSDWSNLLSSNTWLVCCIITLTINSHRGKYGKILHILCIKTFFLLSHDREEREKG